MAEKSGQGTGTTRGEKHFYVSDKRDLGTGHRLLEIVYGSYAPLQMRLVTRMYFFEETDNGREWRDVKLYSGQSIARNLDELAIASRESLSGIGIDPTVFPKLWGKNIGTVVDEIVPFLAKDKVENKNL